MGSDVNRSISMTTEQTADEECDIFESSEKKLVSGPWVGIFLSNYSFQGQKWTVILSGYAHKLLLVSRSFTINYYALCFFLPAWCKHYVKFSWTAGTIKNYMNMYASID